MSERRTIFVPSGTLAFSLPIMRDGKTTASELVWLKPAHGIGAPWVGRSKIYPIDVKHVVPELTKFRSEPKPEPELEPVPELEIPESRWQRMRHIVGAAVLIGLIRFGMLPDSVFMERMS